MTRTYRSSTRRTQRSNTRDRIVATAGRLFTEHGYAGTTLRMVAAQAEVSLERVTAIGGKSALLLAAWEEAINDGEPLGLVRRSDIAPAWAGTDLRAILEALVTFVCSGNVRADGLTAALSEARRSDPGVASAYEHRMASMRAAGREFVTELAARGLCAADLDPTAVADEFWAAAHTTQYELLVTSAGWSPEHFRTRLLERTLALIPPP